jgi:hypothetical protein
MNVRVRAPMRWLAGMSMDFVANLNDPGNDHAQERQPAEQTQNCPVPN